MAEIDVSDEAVKARIKYLRSDDGSDYQRDQVTADLLEALSAKLAEAQAKITEQGHTINQLQNEVRHHSHE